MFSRRAAADVEFVDGPQVFGPHVGFCDSILGHRGDDAIVKTTTAVMAGHVRLERILQITSPLDPKLSDQHGMNILGCVAPFGHRRHGQVVAAAGTVAAGPNAADGGAACTRDRDLASLQFRQSVGL